MFSSIESQTGVMENPATTRFCLIVDDSPMVRKIARKLLSALGFEVDEAENGELALEKCAQRMPDAVLLDWNMPVMDGLQFLTALRRADGGAHPKVIFCTTESDVDHIRRAVEAGADEYLMKPFDRDSLSSKLELVFPGL